jgi:hypothetical protein
MYCPFSTTFVIPIAKYEVMQKARTSSSGANAILVTIVIIITFPIWIGIIGGLFGLVVGGIGGLIGIIAGAFGIVIGAIGSLIGSIFNWGPWHFGFWNGNFFVFFIIVLVIALAIKPRH